MYDVLCIVFKNRSKLIDFAFRQKRELWQICTDKLFLKCIALLIWQVMFLFKWALSFWMHPSHSDPLMDDAFRRLHTWNNFYRKLLDNSFKGWPFLEVCCASVDWAIANPLAFLPAVKCCWSFWMAPAQPLGRSLWTDLWSCTYPLQLTGKHLENLSAWQLHAPLRFRSLSFWLSSEYSTVFCPFLL